MPRFLAEFLEDVLVVRIRVNVRFHLLRGRGLTKAFWALMLYIAALENRTYA